MLAFEKFFAWVRNGPISFVTILRLFTNSKAICMLLQVEGRLSGKMFVEAAKYQMKKEVIGKVHNLKKLFLVRFDILEASTRQTSSS